MAKKTCPSNGKFLETFLQDLLQVLQLPSSFLLVLWFRCNASHLVREFENISGRENVSSLACNVALYHLTANIVDEGLQSNLVQLSFSYQ